MFVQLGKLHHDKTIKKLHSFKKIDILGQKIRT